MQDFSFKQTKKWGNTRCPSSQTHIHFQHLPEVTRSWHHASASPQNLCWLKRTQQNSHMVFVYFSFISLCHEPLPPHKQLNIRISSNAFHPSFSKALLSQHHPAHPQTKVPLGQLPVCSSLSLKSGLRTDHSCGRGAERELSDFSACLRPSQEA